jgi:hypothetical protein
MSACFVPFVNGLCPYVAVNGSDYDGTNHHGPIRKRNIDLPMECGASICRLDLWEVGRMHELYE